MKPIDCDLPLAMAFNKIISRLMTLHIMTMPRTFEDVRGEEAAFKMANYYQTLLWEKWLHGVVERLQEWSATIDEYFDEFDGSWEYYALSKRLSFIIEYGSDDDDDYNLDGTIKTCGISHSQLRCYTIFHDLYHNSMDIVQDTRPADLLTLIEAVHIDARFSVVDMLGKTTGKSIPSYVVDDEGNFRRMTLTDRELHKASRMVDAQDYGQLVYAVAQQMEWLTSYLSTIIRSDSLFSNQHEVLYAFQNDADSILQLDFSATRHFKDMVPLTR